MICSPTLTPEEFKTIHNALCDLDSVAYKIEGVLRPELYEKLNKAVRNIREGLKSAYEQEDHVADKRSEHYSKVQAELGLSSIWSLTEVDNLNDPHPFQGVERVLYKDHWGRKPVECTINGSTWAALYVAANDCILDSGDNHHVFIEDFIQDKDDPSILYVSTGS